MEFLDRSQDLQYVETWLLINLMKANKSNRDLLTKLCDSAEEHTGTVQEDQCMSVFQCHNRLTFAWVQGLLGKAYYSATFIKQTKISNKFYF